MGNWVYIQRWTDRQTDKEKRNLNLSYKGYAVDDMTRIFDCVVVIYIHLDEVNVAVGWG